MRWRYRSTVRGEKRRRREREDRRLGAPGVRVGHELARAAAAVGGQPADQPRPRPAATGRRAGGEVSSYAFDNFRQVGIGVPALLRGLYMRSPGRIQINFAGEQFIDEIASATKQDPIP